MSGILQWCSGLLGTAKGRLKSIGSAGFLAVAVVGVLVAIFLADGFHASTYDLQNPGVWVTRRDGDLVGRFNTQALELDSAIPTDVADVDVAQDGDSVAVFHSGAMKLVDPATEELSETELPLPEGARVELAGGRYLVVDAKGRAWTGTAEGLGSFDPGRKPDVTADAASLVTIGPDGTVAAWSSKSGTLTSFSAGGDRTEVALDGVGGDAAVLQIALAGATPALLDTASARLFLPGADPMDLSSFGDDAQLQLSGDDPEHVVVSTSKGVVTVPAAGGAADLRAEDAALQSPIRPARINGCSYGAWAAPAYMSVRCESGGSVARLLDKVGGTGAGDLRFRINRSNVALNQLVTGQVVIRVGDDLQEIDGDWEPPKVVDPEDEEDDPDPQVKSLNLSKEQQPPRAVDDETGARRNRSTIVSVLDNDSDPNGDVITVVPESLAAPDTLQVSVVSQGQAVQVTPTGDATGTMSFTYAVTDGVAASAPAKVTVEVVDDSVNNPPRAKSLRPQDPVDQRPFQVQMQTPGHYEVLPDWEDPEGDPMVLAGATADDPATGEVQTVPTGRLTFKATGGSPGTRRLDVSVADVPPAGSESKAGSGPLDVTVVGQGQNVGPVAQPDYAVGAVNSNITVHPLSNDVDPNGDPLLITKLVPPAAGWGTAQVVLSPEDGSIVVRADLPGTIIFGYEVTDRIETVQALVRVDVVDVQQNRAPSAGPDLLLLLSDQSKRSVDLLVNDWDPDGDVMMVTGLRLLSGPEVSFQLLEHRRVRAWSNVPLSAPAVFEYTVSDGAAQSAGRLVVAQSPVDAVNARPIVGADTATVRTGDVVSIPVLANDLDPDGDTLRLAPELQRGPEPGQGTAFVSGSVVRFVAPNTPGTVQLSYGVTDDGLTWSSGQVLVNVRAAQDNALPLPQTVEARVLSGNSARVTIPLSGIDPDGDSVSLVGIGPEPAPALGRVVTPVGTDSIIYEAFKSDTGGRDAFTYQVRDSRGGVATGTVRVVVAPRASSNPPQPADDEVTIAPGQSLTVPVLDNDFDPDGDPISLADPALGRPFPDGLDAEVVGSRVRVTAPNEIGPVDPLYYYVTDGPGAQPVVGSIKVTVSADTVGQPPIARDDVARLRDTSADSISVDVRSNDEDPDGDPDDLKVEVVAPSNASVDGGNVVVTPGAAPQVVVYRITDEQKLSAAAVVRVPAKGDTTDLPPEAKPKAGVVDVEAGKTVPIKVADRVIDPEGQPVQLTQGRLVTATKGVILPDMTPTEFTYQASADKVGDASVMFEVTDSPDVNAGNKVTFTVPIRILPGPDSPQTALKLVPGNPVRIGPGDDPVQLDLGGRVDPDTADPGDVTFTLMGADTGGIQIDQVGSRITLTGSKDAKVGDVISVPFEAKLGDRTANGTVEVQIVASSRPQVTCTVEDVKDASAGEEVVVDVLRNCTNPFPDGELELTSATDDGGAGARIDGGSVRLTPKEGFVGTVVVSYEVTDPVGRVTTGVLRIIVRDVPGAPGAPTVVDVSSRQVVLSWTAPDPHGTAITKYLVVASRLSQPFDCGTLTTCTVTGLTNDVEYGFSVKAVNEVGEGPAGPTSTARPDQRPDPPTGVQLTFDKTKPDGKLVAKWSAARTEGSAVTGYELEVTPALPDGTARITLGNVTEHTIDGLENGTAYRVRVRAKNKAATGESDWSADSNAETPAKAPDPPGKPLVAKVADPLGRRIEVRWSAPESNGAAITTYTVVAFPAGSTTAHRTLTVPGNQLMPLVVDLADRDNLFEVVVTATNKAGDSAPSDRSVAVKSESVPDPIASVVATARPGAFNSGGEVQLAFTRPVDGGADIDKYQVSTNGGAFVDVSPSNTVNQQSAALTVKGLAKGSTFNFAVKACNSKGCGNPSTASNQVTAYETLQQPTVTVVEVAQDHVTFQIGAPPSNGLGITLTVDGVARSSGEMIRKNDSCDRAQSLTVVATDEAGQSSSSSRSSSTGPCPTVSISIGDRVAEAGGCVYGDGMATGDSQGCYRLRISLRNFSPGAHTVRCYMTMNNPPQPAVYKTISVGNGDYQDCSFSSAGRWVMVVVDGTIAGGNTSPDQYGWAVGHHSGYLSNVSPQWPTN